MAGPTVSKSTPLFIEKLFIAILIILRGIDSNLLKGNQRKNFILLEISDLGFEAQPHVYKHYLLDYSAMLN